MHLYTIVLNISLAVFLSLSVSFSPRPCQAQQFLLCDPQFHLPELEEQ